MPRALRCLLLAVLLAGMLAPAAEAAKRTTAQRLVSIARAELARGVREVPDGSNKAARIKTYLSATTPSWFGAPWCAYFVSWVARRAGVPIGAQGRGLGYVPYIVRWAKSTKRWKRKPRPGYLVTWPNHVGIVETVSGNTMTTIEGNAGNAVRRRWRRTSDAQGFVALAAGGKLSPAPPKQTKRPKKTAALKARITFYPSPRVRVGDRLELSANDSSGDIRKVRWDFDGDGKYDDAKGDTASLRAKRTGRFKVAVRVYGPSGRQATTSAYVTVRAASAEPEPERLDGTPAEAPAVAVACDRPAVATGERVTCVADTSASPVRVTRLEWDTDGDGTFGRGGSRQRLSFDRPGVRLVAARVTGPDGGQATAVAAVTVVNRVPVADVRGPTTVRAGETITLDAARSWDPDGVVTAVRWDVGGDGVWDAAGARLSFPAPAAGAVRIVAAVQDDAGAVTLREWTVTVLPELRAVIGVLTTPLRAGEAVELTARDSTGPAALTRCLWDFDSDGWTDASRDCGDTLRVTFRTPGTKRVTLTVKDADGARVSTSTELVVG